MSFSNSKINSFLSRTKDKISSFISNALYTPSDKYFQLNSSLSKNQNFNKLHSYNYDYIPFKKNINNSSRNLEKNDSPYFLGLKTSRTNNSEQQRKINIPNEKRYHKSLLETSLDKIRSEIRQKREENISRMNELSNKSDKLNDFFHNENNIKGKFTSMFNSNIEDKDKNDSYLNLDENEQNINNTDSKNEYSLNNRKNLKREFNTEFICSDINESFYFTGNNKKKKLDMVIQKQTEFSFNNKMEEEKNDKKNKNIDIDNNEKIIFGAPKEEIKLEPLSDKVNFGFKPLQKKEEKKEDNTKQNNNEPKILFMAPKEPVLSEPLSNDFSFGVKKEEKVENKKENTSLFGAPKESKEVEPKFGLIPKEEKKEEYKEKEDKVLFGVPKDKNLMEPYVPVPTTFSFGLKKKEENKTQSLFNKNNPFLMNVDNKNFNDKDSTKKEPSSNPFISENNKLFNNNEKEEKKTGFFLEKNDKEIKIVTVNAIDTSNSIFNNKDNDKKESLFGSVGIFEKKDNDNDKNKTSSLFGDSKLINNNNSLFGNNADNNKTDNNQSLFGQISNKNDNNFSLFGNNNDNNNMSLFKTENNEKDNKKSLFSTNNEENKTSLFGNIKPDNNNSLFGNNASGNNTSLFGGENKTSLFGGDNKNSLFGGDNKTPSLFGNASTDNQKSLFGNTNITFGFGK